MKIADEEREVRAGYLVYTPPDTTHSIWPVSTNAPLWGLAFAVGTPGAGPPPTSGRSRASQGAERPYGSLPERGTVDPETSRLGMCGYPIRGKGFRDDSGV
jgi:hypothetical protein